MFVHALKDAASIITIFARSIVELVGLGSADGVFYSAAALKKYLDKQPANSLDKPINAAVTANRFTLKKIIAAIDRAGKYVNLDLGGSPMTEIPFDAFNGCDSLASITIPDNLASIGQQALGRCTSLRAIYAGSGNNAYTSDNGVLYSKDKKTLVVYPSGKTETSFTIPDTVTSIGKDAFCGCANLASVSIPGTVTSIGEGAFIDCKNLASVSIPHSITSIENFAFGGCTSLASVSIPKSVTSIGMRAFYSCESLSSVIIPKSVISIGSWAFSGCASLVSITFQGTIHSSKFSPYFSFPSDIRGKFYAADPINGTPGTYTRAPGSEGMDIDLE